MTTIKKTSNPEWLLLFKNLKDTKVEEIITYEDMDQYVKGNIRDEMSTFYKFRKELLIQENKALENIRRYGYRVVHPREHNRLANNQLRGATRKARKGVEIVLHTNLDMLTQKEQAQTNLMAARMQNLAATLMGENKAIREITFNYKAPVMPKK